MTDKKTKKIKYNTITHAHTDTQNYKHTHTPPPRYSHGEDLILSLCFYAYCVYHAFIGFSSISSVLVVSSVSPVFLSISDMCLFLK